MPPKATKSRKVQKATELSDKKSAEYLLRLIGKRALKHEFPAQVQKRLGDGRFMVKNLINKQETMVTLSKSLFVKKHAAQNKHVQVAIGTGHVVLIDGDIITSRITSDMWSSIKKYLDLPKSANNDVFVFSNSNSKTRKNRKN